MSNCTKRIIAVLTVILMVCSFVYAEEITMDNAEKYISDHGVSFTYDPEQFELLTDENGDVGASYLGDASKLVGFNIVYAEEIDAKAYMTEAAESYGLELVEEPCFGETEQWYHFTQLVTGEDAATRRIVYARNNSAGAWIVTVFDYIEPDEAKAMKISSDMAAVLDTLVFEN